MNMSLATFLTLKEYKAKVIKEYKAKVIKLPVMLNIFMYYTPPKCSSC